VNQASALKPWQRTQAKQLFVCVDNDGYTVSLEKRKIYDGAARPAAEQARHAADRDESGEDRSAKALFRSIALPIAVKAVLAA
jgi:hypothetical protein